MLKLTRILALCALILWLAAASLSAPAQEELERDLTARARVLPAVGAGAQTFRRDSSGRYYVLGEAGTSVAVYAADGKFLAQAPALKQNKTAVVFADDFDVDAAGRLFFADRGGNAVRIFGPDGQLELSIPVTEPFSLRVLPAEEIAVVSTKTRHLVEVFDLRGKVLREFGDRVEMAEHAELDELLNLGRLATDAANHLYFAFSYLPEPTIRKYDRYGYAAQETELTGLDYAPAAQAARREIARQDQRNRMPLLRPAITSIGVDPQGEEMWAAVGSKLLEFSPDGSRRISYRAYTADGVRVDATAILVEPERLLLLSKTMGIFEFARPEKIRNANP